MARRPGARRLPQWKISRIGWRVASRLLKQKGWTLLGRDGGGAVLLLNGEAHHFITARSAELLKGADRGRGLG